MTSEATAAKAKLSDERLAHLRDFPSAASFAEVRELAEGEAERRAAERNRSFHDLFRRFGWVEGEELLETWLTHQLTKGKAYDELRYLPSRVVDIAQEVDTAADLMAESEEMIVGDTHVVVTLNELSDRLWELAGHKPEPRRKDDHAAPASSAAAEDRKSP